MARCGSRWKSPNAGTFDVELTDVSVAVAAARLRRARQRGGTGRPWGSNFLKRFGPRRDHLPFAIQERRAQPHRHPAEKAAELRLPPDPETLPDHREALSSRARVVPSFDLGPVTLRPGGSAQYSVVDRSEILLDDGTVISEATGAELVGVRSSPSSSGV